MSYYWRDILDRNKKVALGRLFAVYSLVAFLIITVLLVVLLARSYRSFIELKRLEMEAAISKVELSISESIFYSESIVNHIAKQISVTGGDKEKVVDILRSFGASSGQGMVKNVLSISMFSWVSSNQYLIANSEIGLLKKPINMKNLKRDYLKNTMRYRDKIFTGFPAIGAVSNQKIIPVGFGVSDAKTREYIGTIVFGFSINELNKKISNVINSEDLKFVVSDREGRIILSSNDCCSWAQKVIDNSKSIKEMLDRSYRVSEFSLFDISGESVLSKDLERYPYRIFIGYKNKIIFTALLKFLAPYLFFSLLSAILFWLLWLMLKSMVVGPILQISQQSKLITDSLDYAVKFPVNRIYEINNLAEQISKINQYKIDLLQAKKSQERFFANMNHELRTPLNGILNFSVMMKEKMLGPLSDEYQEMASDIHCSGKHLLNLINDILDFSKMDLGKFRVCEEWFNISCEVKEAFKIATSDILLERDSLVRTVNNIDPSITQIYFDRRMFKQILLNLLSNATKFTSKGEISLNIFKDESGNLIIKIQDTGIGIREEDLPKLMTEFGQVGDGMSRREKQGSGLGLFLVKKMVEIHGGSFVISSVYNQGTTVIIKLSGNRVK